MRKTTPVRGIRDDEEYSPAVLVWAEAKYPTVDVPGTFEVFSDYCRTHGSMYADWNAALRTWIRNGVDRGFGAIIFKQGRAADPKWMPVLAEAKQYGFREPHSSETVGAYRTEFEMWKSREKRSTTNVASFGDSLKKFG